MRIRRFLLLGLAAVLAGCGGSDGDPDPGGGGGGDGNRYRSQIVFGDSLADVGSYDVGTVDMLGGGTFTIDGEDAQRSPELTGDNWTDVTAARLGLDAPCAAQTGLQGDPGLGFRAPIQNHAGCYGYAQGGARVTEPIGPGHTLTGSPLGALTVPVTAQVANHLALANGRFRDDDLVFVTAGANDVLAEFEALLAGAAAAGPQGEQAYLFDNGPRAIAAVARAAEDLALLVRGEIVGRGARRVVVNNVPDIAATPYGAALPSRTRQLLANMVTRFNEQLAASLAREDDVLLVDLHALVADQVANPGNYGLADVSTPACGLNLLAGSALLCNTSNIRAAEDVGNYLFADALHPTPYGHALAARHILAQMTQRGWL